MAQARPLYDILAGLADEEVTGAAPDEVLREAGHDLPDALLAEAIVSYAGTAPAEVAEHLAPFVTAHGPVPLGDPAATPGLAEGLALLAGAPVPDPADLETEAAPPEDAGGFGTGEPDATVPEVVADPFDLDFGGGDAGEGPGADLGASEGAGMAVPEGFGGFDPAEPDGDAYPVVEEGDLPAAPAGADDDLDQQEPGLDAG